MSFDFGKARVFFCHCKRESIRRLGGLPCPCSCGLPLKGQKFLVVDRKRYFERLHERMRNGTFPGGQP